MTAQEQPKQDPATVSKGMLSSVFKGGLFGGQYEVPVIDLLTTFEQNQVQQDKMQNVCSVDDINTNVSAAQDKAVLKLELPASVEQCKSAFCDDAQEAMRFRFGDRLQSVEVVPVPDGVHFPVPDGVEVTDVFMKIQFGSGSYLDRLRAVAPNFILLRKIQSDVDTEQAFIMVPFCQKWQKLVAVDGAINAQHCRLTACEK